MFRSHSTVRISTRHVASVWSSDLLAFPFYHPHGKGVRQQMWLCHNCHSCGLGWRELRAGEQVTPTAQLTGATHEAGKPRSAPSTPGAKRRPGRAVPALHDCYRLLTHSPQTRLFHPSLGCFPMAHRMITKNVLQSFSWPGLQLLVKSHSSSLSWFSLNSIKD